MNKHCKKYTSRDKSKLPTQVILVLIGEGALTTIVLIIQRLTATTTILPTVTTISVSAPHSNIISDYIF